MNKFIVTMLLLFPAVTLAQQDMMAQMQEMSLCMQSIDQKELKALENDSNQFSTEIKELCDAGKHDEAQEKALKFSRKMMDAPVLKTMRKCMEKLPDSMKGMMPNMDPEEIVKDYSKHNVCDEI